MIHWTTQQLLNHAVFSGASGTGLDWRLSNAHLFFVPEPLIIRVTMSIDGSILKLVIIDPSEPTEQETEVSINITLQDLMSEFKALVKRHEVSVRTMENHYG